MSRRKNLKACRRVVIKIGTSTLTYSNGQLNLQRIERLVREMADLHNRGLEVLLVSSGAIGVGAIRMGYKKIPRTMPEKQALAAIGQGALVQLYEKLFSEYNKTVAQVLLTRGDLDERLRYLNATNALLAILDLGVIPIINENDTVVVEEIKFGDNDTLSALIAKTIHADLLILLSDIDGLYSSDPQSDKDAKLINCVPEITKDIEECSKGSHSNIGTGGMYTKIKAAKIAVSSGISMIIANGSQDGVIEDIVSNKEVGTFFEAKK